MVGELHCSLQRSGASQKPPSVLSDGEMHTAPYALPAKCAKSWQLRIFSEHFKAPQNEHLAQRIQSGQGDVEFDMEVLNFTRSPNQVLDLWLASRTVDGVPKD